MYKDFNNDRFVVPFLLGGLAGGAAVGLSRPRPVYAYNQGGGYNPGPSFRPGVPFYNSSYSYYQPVPHISYY